MATLFGNELAIRAARTAETPSQYPAGAALAEVTWLQREDEHWFGGRTPQRFLSMEVVQVTTSSDGKAASSYERFGPAGQRERRHGRDGARKQAILAERPSPMP
jgi:hypothetical protein